MQWRGHKKQNHFVSNILTHVLHLQYCLFLRTNVSRVVFSDLRVKACAIAYAHFCKK